MGISLDAQAQDLVCGCLISAVGDLEGFARGPLTQWFERSIVFTFARLARLGLIGKVPDLSVGPYQVRLSTAARLTGTPHSRDGRWLIAEAHDILQLARSCVDRRRSSVIAAACIAEALERWPHLDPFAAVAIGYAGESLPRGPYQSRLRRRYTIRSRAHEAWCLSSPCQESPSQLSPDPPNHCRAEAARTANQVPI